MSSHPFEPSLPSTPRETDHLRRENADEVRPRMVEELDGNTIWLPAEAFQNDILPKPPQSVMLSDAQIAVLTERFNEMLAGYDERATKNKVKQEDQLVTEFVSLAVHSFCIYPQWSARPRSSTSTSLLPSKADVSSLARLARHAQSHTTRSPCLTLCQVTSCVCPCIWLTRPTMA